MKRIVLALLVLSSFAQVCKADNIKYSVLFIPEAMLKNANMVIRTEETHFIIRNAGEAVLRHHFVYTILNSNGDEYANFTEFYDKFTDIRNIEGTLYDANGKELKKLKPKDLADKSAVDDISIMDDNRYKFHNFYYRSYPYTIEYDVETKTNNTMFYPVWYPQPMSLVSIQESNFIVTCPQDYDIRILARNYNKQPEINTEKGYKNYNWKVANLSAVSREPYSPPITTITPSIKVGPTDFAIGSFKGNMNTWDEYGKFMKLLMKDRDQLPDDIKTKVHQLTDGVANPHDKIKKLYQFMQDNTRYISIQLGIGGWQPFDAKYVASKRYGDCKALSNYMYSLLKEAGIPSYYTLIRAGSNVQDMITEFPNSNFNHAILCVPVQKDTVWLECTSQDSPAGYMGRFTGNRHAFIITEDGGKVVRTPDYGMNDNYGTRNVKALLQEDGTLNIESIARYGSLQQEPFADLMHNYTRDKVKEYLHEHFDFATYDITNFEYKEDKNIHPSIDEKLDINVSNYATITGKRLFIAPNIMARDVARIPSVEERKYDIFLPMAYRDIDSVVITIPKGYTAEAIPKEVKMESKFGKYFSKVELKDDQIFYYRIHEQNNGHFDAKDYNDLIKYFDAIYKADRNRLVLVKNDNGSSAPVKGF